MNHVKHQLATGTVAKPTRTAAGKMPVDHNLPTNNPALGVSIAQIKAQDIGYPVTAGITPVQAPHPGIADDGNINLVSFVESSGFGLLGIRERVSSLDGQLKFNKNDSGGLNIKVTLPVDFEGDIT